MTEKLDTTDLPPAESFHALARILWLVLHDAGGEIVMTADEVRAAPPVGEVKVQYLPDGMMVVRMEPSA